MEFEKVKDNFEKLYYNLINICVTHRCEQWSQSWMWDLKNNKVIYYHLIYLESDVTLHYEDINHVNIKLECKFFSTNAIEVNVYRIDLRDSKTHNFWTFNDDNWVEVEDYIKAIVSCQYNSLQKLYKLYNLSNDAHIDEPKKMYFFMNIKKRKEKILKINSSIS